MVDGSTQRKGAFIRTDALCAVQQVEVPFTRAAVFDVHRFRCCEGYLLQGAALDTAVFMEWFALHKGKVEEWIHGMNEEEETLLYTAIKEGCAQTVIDALAGVLSEFLVCVAYLEQGKSTPPLQ